VYVTISNVDAEPKAAGIHDEELAWFFLGHRKADLVDPEDPLPPQVGCRQCHE
jgi:hypothetical protein